MADQPFVVMVAGPNGSGKTTLTNQLRRDGLVLGAYVNPDEIAKNLQGTYRDRVAKAQSIADEQRVEHLRRGQSFTFETVMSHPSKVEFLRAAKVMGFRVVVYFVATDSPDLNVARVKQRVALGGHAVPEDRIRKRYKRTLELLPLALELADDVVLFDNTGGSGPDDPARLRPFCRRSREGVTLAGPIPDWALKALPDWFPNVRAQSRPSR